MESLRTLGAFIAVLGMVIFVHEFGHFVTAKLFGMRVFIFSFGFGKRLLGFKWGDTDCRLSLVPLGGYVKLEGEPDDRLSEEVATSGDQRDFTARPRWQRFLVYMAGPVMNAVLTVVIFTILFLVGRSEEATPYDRPVIGAVEANSPAEAAGVRTGDEIVTIDGKPMPNWQQAHLAILLRPDTTVQMRIRRGSEETDLTLQSRSTRSDKVGDIGVMPLIRLAGVVKDTAAEAAGLKADDGIVRIGGKPVPAFGAIPSILREAGDRPLAIEIYRGGATSELSVTPREGKIGIEPRLVPMKFPFPGAFYAAVAHSWRLTEFTFETIGRLVTGRLSFKSMSGPLGIAQESGRAAQRGTASFFDLVALISLQVGLLNLFPLVPLDGGHLAILVAEGVARRDLSPAVKNWIMNAGVALVLLLVAAVLFSDISKTSLFGGK